MSNMSHREPGMEILDEKRYRDEQYRDDVEDFDAAMDQHAPIIQDTLQNRDSLIRGIVNGTTQPSPSNRKRSSRRPASHATSSSLTSTNTATPRAPLSASSSHHGHARHASTSAVNGNGHSAAGHTVDKIDKLISSLAIERQKTASLQDNLTRAHADTQFHAKRLEDAEARVNEQKKREAENAKRRKTMDVEVSKMREQLRFIKLQYDGAINEIKKAQDVINSLEEERGRAVDEARKEREKVRILEEERKLKEAREQGYEEGKRLGMEEGVKKGSLEGKRYGLKDGRETERERQKRAMRELAEDDSVYDPKPPKEQERISEPREVYHRVGDETPGLERSRSLNINPGVAPVVTVDPRTQTASVIGLPLLQTGNPSASGYPSTAPANLSRHPSAPVGNPPRSTNGTSRYNGQYPLDNANVNILAGFQDEPIQTMGMNAPELSMEASLGKRDNRTSAPPRINTGSVDRDRDRPDHGSGHKKQNSWGGGIIGTGQGYRAPVRQRSDSGGASNGASGVNGHPRHNGRTSVTPPSTSTGTPLDQYGILADGGYGGGGLIQQVNEMTPIMEAGSEPGPTPTQAYFSDAAMGVRPSHAQQQETERREREKRAQEQRDAEERVRIEQELYRQRQEQEERHRQQQEQLRWQQQQREQQQREQQQREQKQREQQQREQQQREQQQRQQQEQKPAYQPPQRRTEPSPTYPTGPSVNEWRQTQPPAPAANTTRGQRKPVPATNGGQPNGRARGGSVSVPRTSSRAGSVDMHGPGPAAHRPGAGAAGGHSLPPIEIFPGTPPDQANAKSSKMAQAGQRLMGSPAFMTGDIGYDADPGAPNGHPGRGEYDPHGPPPRSPRPQRSPLPNQAELHHEYMESDPSDHYRSSNQQHTGGHRRGAMSMGDSGRPQPPPASPSRFTTGLYQQPSHGQPQPPPSPSRFVNPDLAQPTPRRPISALDMSPEDIMIHPSGLTPTPTRGFETGPHHNGAPSHVNNAKGKGKAKPSAKVKQMRRQGYVDYDDEVPEDLTMGYSVRDQEPPMTTRSRVQSMYGISGQGGPKRTPVYEDAPLPAPRKTPAYEDAPLPPPKSARMMSGTLPKQQQHNSGYSFGSELNSAFGRHGEPMASPIKSVSSSQIRREMEDDLDTPIVPYDQQRGSADSSNRYSTVDILEEQADNWEPRSNTFVERQLPRTYQDEVEVVPPPNASPQARPVRQDASFLGTANHPPPPPSPGVTMRGPPSAYVDTRDFDDSSMGHIRSGQPESFMVDQHGNPIRSPMRQSMPITASARSSTSAMPLPPVQPKDIPWATGKTTNSQLPRPDTMYESAPPTASVVPNTATTWGYVRESGQSLAPLGPLSNGGLGFSFGNGMANQAAAYNLANASPVSTGRAQPMPLPTFQQNPMASARAPSALLPPGSTRSNIMNIPGTTRSNIMNLAPGSTRSNIMNLAPGTARSIAQPLPPQQSQSQMMLAGMLSPQGPGPEMDDEPIIPSGGGVGGAGVKKKKGGKKKK